jgi:hypothetical protein
MCEVDDCEVCFMEGIIFYVGGHQYCENCYTKYELNPQAAEGNETLEKYIKKS